jgi:hypothetical protein
MYKMRQLAMGKKEGITFGYHTDAERGEQFNDFFFISEGFFCAVAVRKTHKLYTFFSRFSFALVCV